MGEDARRLQRTSGWSVAARTPDLPRKLHDLRRCGGPYRTMRRSREPPASEPHPEGPCARDPPLSRAPLRLVDDRRPGARRRPAVRRDRRGTPADAARPPPGERGPPRPARRGAGRRGRRSLPAGGADAGRLALRRDPPQGPASVDLRLRADVPGARHGRVEDAARVLRPTAPGVLRARIRRAAARADAVGAAGGSLQAAAGHRGQHEPGGRSCTTTRPAPARRSSRPPRTAPQTSTCSTTTGFATGCGRCRRTARRADAVGAAARRGRTRSGHDRGRPPPLRDGAPVSRRAPDVAVVRGGPGVRLHPDALPGVDRPAADRPADPSDPAEPGRRRRRAAPVGARRAVRGPARG